MLNIAKFTTEEDEFLLKSKDTLRVSRMAVALKRPYKQVLNRCEHLGIVKIRKESKFCSDDEIEYDLLMSGCTEEEIRRVHGTKSVLGTRHSL